MQVREGSSQETAYLAVTAEGFYNYSCLQNLQEETLIVERVHLYCIGLAGDKGCTSKKPLSYVALRHKKLNIGITVIAAFQLGPRLWKIKC